MASAPHSVQPGESLWSISAANNLTTRTVAVYNGLTEQAGLIAGTTIYVPTVEEGAAALATGAPAVAAPAVTAAPAAPAAATSTATAVPGTGRVTSPYGELQLIAAAADAWNAMRAESLSAYGVDLYPGGQLSAYRTYDQQVSSTQAFLAGWGAPANPPGSSSHEWGPRSTSEPADALGGRPDRLEVRLDQGARPHEWWHVDYVGG